MKRGLSAASRLGMAALLAAAVAGCVDGGNVAEPPLVQVPAEALGLESARPTVYYVPTYRPEHFEIVIDEDREGWYYAVASSLAMAWGIIEFGYYADQSDFGRGTALGVLGRSRRNYEATYSGYLVWWSDSGVHVRVETTGLDLQTVMRFIDGLEPGGQSEWRRFVDAAAR
jgi:hypothetical protein